jgi:hypothetical protein
MALRRPRTLTETTKGYLKNIVARGLEIFVRLLAVEDHETLVNKMQRCLTRRGPRGMSMGQALWPVVQRSRRNLMATNARDDAQLRRDPMEFTGDAVPPEGPPLAWVLLWNGLYSNIYAEYVPSTVRNWGYVMWDERRWNELGARDIVVRQWETVPSQVESIEKDFGWRPTGW